MLKTNNVIQENNYNNNNNKSIRMSTILAKGA